MRLSGGGPSSCSIRSADRSPGGRDPTHGCLVWRSWCSLATCCEERGVAICVPILPSVLPASYIRNVWLFAIASAVVSIVSSAIFCASSTSPTASRPSGAKHHCFTECPSGSSS
jgi:hypothetical protein